MAPKKTLLVFTLLIGLIFMSCDAQARVYRFSGGPSGGTYQYYASAIATLSKDAGYKVLASSSGGSIENIRMTNSGKTNFAVSYSGDVYHARNGELNNDDRKYEDVLAVCYFYSAPAQLIVRKKSGITKAVELKGKKVGVGNAGSGAAANAEIFFKGIGIWDDMKHENLGYRGAADAFKNKQLDAFWVFAGFPNAAVLEAALQADVALLNVYNDADEAGLFKKYPYYTQVTIPKGTYKGMDKPVSSYQDATLWIANPKVPDEVVYDLLAKVFSEEGLSYMVEVHKSAKAMSIKDGVNGIVTPMHPGAEKFWREKGVLK